MLSWFKRPVLKVASLPSEKITMIHTSTSIYQSSGEERIAYNIKIYYSNKQKDFAYTDRTLFETERRILEDLF